MPEIQIHLIVNGQEHDLRVRATQTLLSLLRDQLDLISVKSGCEEGDCGACVVLMDGQAVNSCLVLAPQADGAEIITVEGLASHGKLHPLQHAFAEHWAFQCGYCTPGMLMSCYALLINNPEPTVEDIRTAITGNLCRCTGYQKIIEAVQCAAEEMKLSAYQEDACNV